MGEGSNISQFVKFIAEWSAAILELLGIGIIIILALYALGYALFQIFESVEGLKVFRQARHRLIRGILLGLELLVAADIIHTVAVELSFESVGVLAIIVAIRTFLSFSLEVEMTGHWPWQNGHQG